MLKLNVIDVARDKGRSRKVYYTDDGYRYRYNSGGKEPGQDMLFRCVCYSDRQIKCNGLVRATDELEIIEYPIQHNRRHEPDIDFVEALKDVNSIKDRGAFKMPDEIEIIFKEEIQR